VRQGLQWYHRYPIAFLDGVQGLGPELIGAYAVLIDLIYARDGNTVRDDRHLAGIMGCSPQKARFLTNKLIEKNKITVSEDGTLSNPRADQQIQHKTDIGGKRAAAGSKGGRAGRGVSKAVRDRVLNKRVEVEP
jgi:uncharacterized protein YdaU (DUF1376 family)